MFKKNVKIIYFHNVPNCIGCGHSTASGCNLAPGQAVWSYKTFFKEKISCCFTCDYCKFKMHCLAFGYETACVTLDQ